MNYGHKYFNYINEALKELDLNVNIKVPMLTIGTAPLPNVELSNLTFTKDLNNNGLRYVFDKEKIVYRGNTFTLSPSVSYYYSGERLLQMLGDNASKRVGAEIISKSNVWQLDTLYMLLEFAGFNADIINVFKINSVVISGYDAFKSFAMDGHLSFDAFLRYDMFGKLNSLTPVYTKSVDILNLNFNKCDDANLNKVFVYRRGKNYGAFEIEPNEINDNSFARCPITNYITTSLSNYFNERTSLPFNISNTRYIASINFLSVNRCSDCGRTDYSSLGVDDVPNRYKVDNYGANNFCKDCAQVILNSGVDIATYTPNLYAIGGNTSNPSTLNFGKFDSEVVPLYMGVELEVDTQAGNSEDGDNYEDDENAERFETSEQHLHSNIALHKISNNVKNTIFSKTDGSLSNGFEIVSHPMTLAKHLKSMQWQKGMDYLSNTGYKSHNTTTCGLHIHINRNFFGATKPNQSVNGSKIAYIMEKNIVDFTRFTRRKGGELTRWARFGDMSSRLSAKTKSMLLSAFRNQYYHRNKYVALNTIHEHTFEFRIFKGTLNYNTFVATLQLVDNLARLVKDIPNNDDMFTHLDKITFDDIVNYRPYAELTAYWTARKVVQ